MNKLYVLCVATAVGSVALGASSVQAAFFAGWGTLALNRDGPDFSLCFAGDAVDTRADRVMNVLDHLRHVEWAANIKFYPPGNKGIRIQSGTPLVATDWRCPNTAAVSGSLPQGDLGDVRILLDTHTAANNALWNTDPVGGAGCAIINVGGGASWGATGNEPRLSKWCNFNLKLGDAAPLNDPSNYYLNHTLHEIAHKLGLDHDQSRADAVCAGGGTQNGSVGFATNASGVSVSSEPVLFMTPVDKASVTNYVNVACGTKGNFDFTGLSPFDALALRILYPETNRVAELSGVRVVKAGQPLNLGNLWKHLGAFVDISPTSVAKDFSWTMDGVQLATTPDLFTKVGEGRYSLVYAYRDFRGRSYSFQTKVEVLTPAKFAQRMAAQAVILGINAQ